MEINEEGKAEEEKEEEEHEEWMSTNIQSKGRKCLASML